MNNSQSSALILLAVIAVIFWLFNSKTANGSTRLSAVVAAITGSTPAAASTNIVGNGVFNQPSGSVVTSLLPGAVTAANVNFAPGSNGAMTPATPTAIAQAQAGGINSWDPPNLANPWAVIGAN